MRLAHSFTLFKSALINIVNIGGVLELFAIVFARTSLTGFCGFEMPRAQRLDCGGEAR